MKNPSPFLLIVGIVCFLQNVSAQGVFKLGGNFCLNSNPSYFANDNVMPAYYQKRDRFTAFNAGPGLEYEQKRFAIGYGLKYGSIGFRRDYVSDYKANKQAYYGGGGTRSSFFWSHQIYVKMHLVQLGRLRMHTAFGAILDRTGSGGFSFRVKHYDSINMDTITIEHTSISMPPKRNYSLLAKLGLSYKPLKYIEAGVELESRISTDVHTKTLVSVTQGGKSYSSEIWNKGTYYGLNAFVYYTFQ